jgi:hypothetical protein
MGGHLPSAARTNSVPVLFRNYLRGDPAIVDWAEQIMGEAVADAEQSALAAHQRALDAAGGALRVIPARPMPGIFARSAWAPAPLTRLPAVNWTRRGRAALITMRIRLLASPAAPRSWTVSTAAVAW